MGKMIRFLRRIRIRFRRSTSLTKTVVVSAVALSVAALLTLQLTIDAAQAKADALKNEAAQLEQENKELKDKVGNLGSAEGVQEEARDEGMVGADEVIITTKPQQ